MGVAAAKALLNFPVNFVFGTLQHPVSNKLHGGWFTVPWTRSHYMEAGSSGHYCMTAKPQMICH